MTRRLLLPSFLLVLGFNAHAAMDRVHGSSGDAGPTCPPATLADTDTPAEAKQEAVAPAAVRPAAPATTSPTMPRPSLRWHSFLPGMMK